MWKPARTAPEDEAVHLFYRNTIGGENWITPLKWHAWDMILKGNACHPANALQLTHWWDGEDVPTEPPGETTVGKDSLHTERALHLATLLRQEFRDGWTSVDDKAVAEIIAAAEGGAWHGKAVDALRQIDLLAAEMGYPDTLGVEEARERILEITTAALTTEATPGEGGTTDGP